MGRQLPTVKFAVTPKRCCVSNRVTYYETKQHTKLITFLSTVDELAGVHALSGDKDLFLQSVSVWVTEDHSGKWSSTARVMDNLPYDSTDVSMSFSIIEVSELRSTLAMGDMRFEDRPCSLTLTSDDATHLEIKSAHKTFFLPPFNSPYPQRWSKNDKIKDNDKRSSSYLVGPKRRRKMASARMRLYAP